jgi:hypothetical protein
MKTFLTLLISFVFTSGSYAGIIGWITSEARDWAFIQQTGGIRIGTPIEKGGTQVLPVEYGVQGTVAITCKPTSPNSGLTVRRIDARVHNSVILVRVFTQVVEKGSDPSDIHYAALSSIPAGSYEVYYETATDPAKRLGQIAIR